MRLYVQDVDMNREFAVTVVDQDGDEMDLSKGPTPTEHPLQFAGGGMVYVSARVLRSMADIIDGWDKC